MKLRAATAAGLRLRQGLVLGLISLFASSLAAVPVQAAGKAVFSAVIDAGSSGTRLRLYKVLPGPYPKVTDLGTFEHDDAEDGIDDFLNHVGGPNHNLGPHAVGDAVFKPLLDDIRPTLAAHGVKPADVIVDVLATAGMRRVVKPIGTHTRAEVRDYYAFIRSYIGKQGFAAGQARTTDGNSEEGVWTWVDLNDYYRQAFTSKTAPVGVVEVGGSSTQISYPTKQRLDSTKNVYSVTLNGKTFHVFSRTFLGLGQDDARKSMRVETPPGNGGANCFPTGMKPSEDAGDLIDDKVVAITKVAKFNGAACQASYSGILASHFASIGDPMIGNSTGPFYGVAGIRYTLADIGVAPNRPSPNALANLIAKKCAPADAVKNFDMKDRYSQRTCSGAVYAKALLYGPAGLFHKKPSLFVRAVADQVEKNGTSKTVVAWTRGYLLLKYSK